MEENYSLPRDSIESSRLIEQHKFLLHLQGCLLHPVIPTNKAGIRIADMATGTGIWLLDLAKKLPADAELHGFDISSAQFPDMVPENLKFHEQSITEPYPAEFTSFFDVIAVRLVTLGLRGDDWDKAVTNLTTLLKPGGYLQWLDGDHSEARVLTAKAGAPNSASTELMKHITAMFKRLMYPGPLRLPSLFRENGLEVVADETYGIDRDPEWRFANVLSFLEPGGKVALGYLIKDENSEMTAEKADALLKAALEEIASGDLYVHTKGKLVVGRKS